MLLLRSEAQARKRVVYFLTVFTITGLGSMCICPCQLISLLWSCRYDCFCLFIDFLLGYLFAIYESIRIHRGDWTITTTAERDHLHAFPMVFYTIQVSGLCVNSLIDNTCMSSTAVIVLYA